MTNAVVLDEKDIKKMLADKFGVPESAIIKAQYSYIIKKEEEHGRSNQEDD